MTGEPRVRCPAARPQSGPPASLGGSVVCGVLLRESGEVGVSGRDRDSGGAPLMKADPRPGAGGDAGTVRAFCCGAYTACVIWRAEQRRLAQAKAAARLEAA